MFQAGHLFCNLGVQVIGVIDGSGRVKVVDKLAPPGTPMPEDLDLNKVLGKMPSKTYNFTRCAPARMSASPVQEHAAPSAVWTHTPCRVPALLF